MSEQDKMKRLAQRNRKKIFRLAMKRSEEIRLGIDTEEQTRSNGDRNLDMRMKE
jgi:hypothetical protein